jgi:hypothetical protein
LAYANKKIYFRSKALLGELKIAVLSAKTLKLESIEDVKLDDVIIDAVVSEETRKSADVVSSLVLEKCIFEFHDNEVVDLRASYGVKFRISSAVYNDIDFTEDVQNFVDEQSTSLHIESMLAVFGDPTPGVTKRLLVECEVFEAAGPESSLCADGSNIQEKEIIQPPITSDGKSLVMLTTRNQRGKDSLSIFNPLKDIEFHSCYYYETNNEGGNVLDIVKTKWLEFLDSAHNPNYLPISVENDTFSDTQEGVVKTLWINFSFKQGEVQTVSFTEHSVIEWEKILSVARAEASGIITILTTIVVDPTQEMRVVHRAALSIPSSLLIEKMENTSILSNGKKVAIQQTNFGEKSNEEIVINSFLFDISAKVSNYSEIASRN